MHDLLALRVLLRQVEVVIALQKSSGHPEEDGLADGSELLQHSHLALAPVVSAACGGGVAQDISITPHSHPLMRLTHYIPI